MFQEQVLDYWSKIVLDQREFREKLLKAGNGTLFPDTVSILNKLSEREKWIARGLHESETWTLQSVGIVSEKLLRRVSDLPESLRSVWSVLLISSANEEEARHKQQPIRDKETVPQERTSGQNKPLVLV